MSTRKVTINISLKSYLLGAAVVLSIFFFQHILSLISLLFVAFLVSIAVGPLVNFLEKKRVPRSISSFLILLFLFSGIATLAVSLISPLINQTTAFLAQLPPLIEKLAPYNIDFSSILTPQFSTAGGVIKIALGTFSGVIAFFTLIVIAYYMIQDRPNLEETLVNLFGETKGNVYFHAVSELELRLGAWVRGELFLMALVGSLNYVGFLLIGLPSAIPLAVIAGLLELIPNVGPTVAAIPAVIVGFSISPTIGFMTVGLAILVQQLENNLFVPKVMQKAIGLHPVVTIVVLSVGFKLGGPILAILALPLVLSIRVLFAHLHSVNSWPHKPDSV